jgi:hypothetical protein
MSFSHRIGLASIAISMLAMHFQSQAQENTRNGALLGGAAGAVIGGIIGNNKNDQTAEGALIGGAVGAVTGGLIGRHRDQVVQQQQQRAMYGYGYGYPYGTYPAPRATYPNQYGYPHRPTFIGPGQPTIVQSAPVVTRHGVYRSPSRPVPARQPVTLQEVIHMSRNRVSDTVIVSHIQANGVAVRPSVDDVIMLSQQGVSDYVITALQNSGAVEVIVEPTLETIDPAGSEVRNSDLMPVPPLRSQRRGF